MTEVTLRPALPSDAAAVADFCQPIYAAIYPNAKYGMKAEHFSPKVFQSADTREYFAHLLTNHDSQRAYVAETPARIVGSINIERLADHYAIHSYYVDPMMQGQGIGKRLMRAALEFCTADLPIRLEVAETNLKTISLYEHWGFQIAPELGLSLRHWPEWPDNLENGYIFMQAHQGDLHV